MDWKAKGHQVELVGSELGPGGAAHRLKVTLKSGVVRHIWLDAKTRLSSCGPNPLARCAGATWPLETVYGDYREAGVHFAHSIEIGMRGRPQRLRIVVENVEINPALDDSRFAARAEAGASSGLRRARREGCFRKRGGLSQPLRREDRQRFPAFLSGSLRRIVDAGLGVRRVFGRARKGRGDNQGAGNGVAPVVGHSLVHVDELRLHRKRWIEVSISPAWVPRFSS